MKSEIGKTKSETNRNLQSPMKETTKYTKHTKDEND
jgi:hypothetical protein